MKGTYNNDLFAGTHGKGLAKLLQTVAIAEVFNHSSIHKLEIAAEKILCSLLDIFVPSVIYFDTDKKLSGFEKRVINLISKSHMSVYQQCAKNADEKDKLYLRLMMVTDFISGMTDSYAKSLYRELNGLD